MKLSTRQPARAKRLGIALSGGLLVALLATLVPGAAASSSDGLFYIRAEDPVANLSAMVGMTESASNGGGGEENPGGGGTTPDPEPEVKGGEFTFTMNTGLCTTPELSFIGTAKGGTVKSPAGEVVPLNEGGNLFAQSGQWTVMGTFTKLNTPTAAGKNCLISVDKWGETGTTDVSSAFYNATNLTSVAAPPSTITNANSMFSGATAFNDDLSDWDTSNVTDMGWMFSGATAFAGDVSTWDTRKVTTTQSMFSGARVFNGNLANWKTPSLTNMEAMFSGAWKFQGGNLNGWDTSKVTNMVHTFSNASQFIGDISNWDVTSVKNMSSMFLSATRFNGDLTKWDVANVESMNSMFYDAYRFTGNLSGWKVGKVTNMAGMFNYASAFSSDLSKWDVCGRTVVNTNFSASSGLTTAKLPKWGCTA